MSSGERLLHLAPTLNRDHDGAHAVTLGEHELLHLTPLELGQERAEVAHRLAHGAELVRTDPDGRWFGGHADGT